jgi:lysozyme
MCYQLGLSGFSKFKKTIYYLETQQYDEAADEMLDSLWAKQTPNRAKELSNIIRSLL